MNVTIRECCFPLDLLPMTELLYRANADLAKIGLRYVASHQTPEVTERRARSGYCLVAEEEGRLVGTITIRKSRPDAPISLYREEGLMIFGQFGVEPSLRGKGIGKLLHDHVIKYALASEAKAIALDTAAPALHLIEMYLRWGYIEIERHSWPDTNYESVVMKKELRQPNQALEPTHTAVTDRASARSAPAVCVAHL
jgi:GNAT superfamily N-acetyltransferase